MQVETSFEEEASFHGFPVSLDSSQEQEAESFLFSDEELPHGLPTDYDWIMRPDSQLGSSRAPVMLVLLFVIAVRVLSNSFSSLWGPSIPSRRRT